MVILLPELLCGYVQGPRVDRILAIAGLHRKTSDTADGWNGDLRPHA